MEIGEELRTWLQDTKKAYTARIEFAIKAWQSLEFAYINKHEIICQWLAETLLADVEAVALPVAQLQQLFGLRAQPGLVNVSTKSDLILALLKRVEKSPNELGLAQLLQRLLNFELVQDALRADYTMAMRCYSLIFSCYEQQILTADPVQVRHADFVLPLLQQLRDYVQRAQDQKRLLDAYTETALQPLCQLLLQLRERDFCCFEQLAALELQFTEQADIAVFRRRMSRQPMHVQLLLLECALLNYRFDPKQHYQVVHLSLDWKSEAPAGVVWPEKSTNRTYLAVKLATHAFNSLRRHNIPLQFTEKTQSHWLPTLANRLFYLVRRHKYLDLADVAQLLGAAVRCNPLLVEANLHQYTIWMMMAVKRSAEELHLCGEYLVLMLDLCRRMSRTERLVMQLLKSLREWLQKFELPALSTPDSKRPRLATETETEATETETERPPANIYVQLMFKSSHVSDAACSLERLAQTWPVPAGDAFTRLISQLMSKPSIVIWKMLLHSFAELFDMEAQAVLPTNLDFAIELQATLLGQYLLGSRLAEQLQQHQPEIDQQRRHTIRVLQQFGRHLLAREHNRRTMNVFLECVERATSFDLLLAYYRPDGFNRARTEEEEEEEEEQLPQLERILAGDEWELIQQRVHNFGKSSCRQRLQRLELQLLESGWLLLPDRRHESCPDALVELVPGQLLAHLTRAQKQLRLHQHQHQHRSQDLLEDAECVELLAVQLLQEYAASLKEARVKGSLLGKQLPLAGDEAALANSLREHCASTKQPALPEEASRTLVEALHQLPLAQLNTGIKSRLWLLIFTLHHDVQRAQLTTLAEQLLEQLIDLLHFGQPLPLCGYFPELEQLLQLLPLPTEGGEASAAWRFYETFFGRCIRRLTPGSDVFLGSCATYFREQLAATSKLSGTQCRLLLLAIGSLANGSGVQAKRLQRHLQPLLEIYGQFVAHKFRSHKKPPAVYKDFVQQTLSGYAIYLSSCINRAAKQRRDEEAATAETTTSEFVQPIDENFRRICKIYIGHSLNYRNSHAIRLLNVALTHRQLLHLDQDEIEFVLDSYWRQLNTDIASALTLDMASIEPAVKLIIGYKTNEDFLLLLRRLSLQLDGMQRPETDEQHTSLQNVLILLALFAKCSLSSIKGAMLNEHFELISGNVALRLPAASDAAYAGHVLRLLEAQRALATNRTVPLTGETLDSLLGSMLDVNIKRFIIAGGSWTDFRRLHAALSENCLLLLRQQASLMSDRAAQLTALCQDLVQSIVCYRSERKQAQSLTDEELDGLSELALKLVSLMAGIAAGPQALAVKRVAPFLLIFTIKQMIATERPTTLFEKVKVHMDRFCHELISICDHRAGHFILRASSEAGARMYQNLVKEHDKYHKFRGKV